MNGSCETPPQQLCGCCQGIGAETPEPISNRPGLSVISYRVGTHATFKASLLAALSDSNLPALAPLRTRDDSDFSIALLDAWAVSLDILSFYQERIASEAYLGTAVDAPSVMGLAQLVGYKPSPGVAASAFLAFTLSSAPGSPDNVLIPAGSRVQSVPKPGQSPQVFETSSDLTGLIDQNAIPAQSTIPWGLNLGDKSLWLKGTANSLSVGDGILFVSQALHAGAAAGSADFHFITAVTIDSNSGNTLIEWDQPLDWPTSNDNSAYLYVFRKKAGLFGSPALDPRALTKAHLSGVPGYWAGHDWKFSSPASQINLDASYAGLAPQKNGEPQWIVLRSPFYTALYQITAAVDSAPLMYTLTAKTTQLTLSKQKVLVNLGGAATNKVLHSLVRETRSVAAFVQSALLAPADSPLVSWSYDGTYARQSGLLKPVEGSSLEILGTQQLSAGQPVAVSGKRLRLQVSTSSQPLDSQAGFVPDGATGSKALSDGQIFLVDAFPPQAAKASEDLLWSVLTTDGVAGTLEINPANTVLIPADKNDPVEGESTTISQVSVLGPIVTLSFAQPLARLYDRGTVTVNANVVAATNGETMHEILGSGDATQAALQFTVKQSPLTYVSSPLGMGADSTLQVWVNNLRWHEVDNFLDSGPSDRVFVTQGGAAGKVTVQFGDGVEGARTPTGQMNIRGVYRKGIGAGGNVQSGQLSQPLDRPQGLKGVTNPDPATGGADPDSADAARVSAPLHVLTLERVVSLEDYQNYALAFAGIAKALASWTWVGRTRGVFLTVAGANGSVFQQDDPTVTNLIKALRSAGNPYVPLTVKSFSPVLYEIAANVRVDVDNYDPTRVLAQVWQSLATSLGFASRQPGQGVAQSEIIALIQPTPGVIAAELTAFNRQGQPPPPGAPLAAILRAAAPRPGQQGTPQAAEMLLLDPASQGSLEVWS
jgi:hypothetical protein